MPKRRRRMPRGCASLSSHRRDVSAPALTGPRAGRARWSVWPKTDRRPGTVREKPHRNDPFLLACWAARAGEGRRGAGWGAPPPAGDAGAGRDGFGGGGWTRPAVPGPGAVAGEPGPLRRLGGPGSAGGTGPPGLRQRGAGGRRGLGERCAVRTGQLPRPERLRRGHRPAQQRGGVVLAVARRSRRRRRRSRRSRLRRRRRPRPPRHPWPRPPRRRHQHRRRPTSRAGPPPVCPPR